MAKERIKSKKQIEPIADWGVADLYIDEIGGLQLEIKKHEKTANDAISKARANFVTATTPLLEKITILTDSLEAFAINHTEDFGKAQSKKLVYGTVGWRRSTAISIKQSTLDLIKKIFGKKAENYIRTEESVIKEELKALTDAELSSIDARRKPKEVFFVEPDLPEAVNYEK